MIGVHKRNWHLVLYSALWPYRNSVRSATRFTPFEFMDGLEVILLIQCELSSLKLVVYLLPNTSNEEAHILNLIHLYETCREASLANEAHMRQIKVKYDYNVKHRIFSEGDLVFLYDQEADLIGTRKFEPLWHGP